MRICLVYDCLFPYTVGGAERWYRNLGDRLSEDGHEVTYLTLRQWDRGDQPRLKGIDVRPVGPRMGLYGRPGRRRILPPIVFGVGVWWHLIRFGRRYDIVHTASFPYFSLLAAAAAAPFMRASLFVDWHEVWSRTYWREYLGELGGRVGWLVQSLCARLPQRSFCFSQLHAGRLRDEGLRGEITVLRGEYAGPPDVAPARPADPLVVFAGRLIPEKRAVLGVAAVAAAAERISGLRAVFYGSGPESQNLHDAIARHRLGQVVRAPGFAPSSEVHDHLSRATCMLLPSSREGYGMIVVEAAACATPSVVVAGEDNAATELIEDGVNGVIVDRAEARAIADAIVQVHHSGLAMRERTAGWFASSYEWLSLDHSLGIVLTAYRRAVGVGQAGEAWTNSD